MYTLVQVESATPQTTTVTTNTWSPWGINLLDALELQSGNNVINSENYNLNANWNLESRKWITEFIWFNLDYESKLTWVWQIHWLVASSTGEKIFAVAEESSVRKVKYSSDSWENWNDSTLPANSNPNDVCCSSDWAIVYVICYWETSYPAILKSTDSGANFSTVYTSSSTSTYYWESIDCSDDWGEILAWFFDWTTSWSLLKSTNTWASFSSVSSSDSWHWVAVSWNWAYWYASKLEWTNTWIYQLNFSTSAFVKKHWYTGSIYCDCSTNWNIVISSKEDWDYIQTDNAFGGVFMITDKDIYSPIVVGSKMFAVSKHTWSWFVTWQVIYTTDWVNWTALWKPTPPFSNPSESNIFLTMSDDELTSSVLIEDDWVRVMNILFDVSWKIWMLEKFSDNIFVFSAENTIYYYTISTDTITTVWSYWESTDTDFVWVKYWDYLYFTNWTWKIQYLTFNYEIQNDDVGNVLVPKNGNYVEDSSSHTIQLYWDEWSWWYQVNTYEANYVWYFVMASWGDRTDPDETIWQITSYADHWWGDEQIFISFKRWTTFTWNENLVLYSICFDEETNRTAKILYRSNLNATYWWEFETPLSLDSSAVYKIDVSLKSSWESTANDADSFLAWFWDSTLQYRDFWWTIISRIDYVNWTYAEPYWYNNTWTADSDYAYLEIQKYDIYKQDPENLTDWELSNSPEKTKRLLVFADTDWARLYAWNIGLDNTAIKYSALDQVKDIWQVAFETWTSSNEPLLRTDAWGFTNSNLWELKDLWILNSEVVGLFENWKKAFHIEINTVEESWVAIQVQKIVSRERQDFWWERNPLLTQDWLFYTNEAWVWQMLAMWTDVTWWPQETNISEDLGQDLVDSIDWTNCDIVNDIKKRNILVTCGLKVTGYNDLILVYNLKNRSWAKYTWLNIERFLKDSGTIYGSSSKIPKAYTLFEWTDDDWTAISTEFKFEIPLKLKTIFSLEELIAKGEFVWDDFEITLDTYDNRGVLKPGVKIINANLQGFNSFSTLITSLTRLIVTIKCNTTDQHKITYLLAWIKTIQENKFRTPYT